MHCKHPGPRRAGPLNSLPSSTAPVVTSFTRAAARSSGRTLHPELQALEAASGALQGRAPEGWEFHDVEEEFKVDAQGLGAWVPVPPPQQEAPTELEALLPGKRGFKSPGGRGRNRSPGKGRARSPAGGPARPKKVPKAPKAPGAPKAPKAPRAPGAGRGRAMASPAAGRGRKRKADVAEVL